MRHETSSTVRVACLLLLGAALAGCASSGDGPNYIPESKATSNKQIDRNLRGAGKTKSEAAALNVQLGQSYLSRGQLDLAMQKLQKAVALDPKSSDAHTVIAVLYEQIGNRSKAEEHYRMAYRLAPESGDTNNNLGRYLCNAGKLDESDPYFARALLDPFYRRPETALTNRAACADKAGNLELAERSLRAAIERSPNFPEALLMLSQLSLRSGDFLKARAFLERYLAQVPADPAILVLGMQIESKLGNARAEQGYRDRLLSEFPDSEQASTVVKGSMSP
ncbi:MAG: type IV pilus biogenesis/stability protein PilW [Lysobacterales bacterium]